MTDKIVKLQKLGDDLVITLPISICEQLMIKEERKMELEPFTCRRITKVKLIKSKCEENFKWRLTSLDYRAIFYCESVKENDINIKLKDKNGDTITYLSKDKYEIIENTCGVHNDKGERV